MSPATIVHAPQNRLFFSLLASNNFILVVYLLRSIGRYVEGVRVGNVAALNDTGGNENGIGSPDTYFARNVSRLLSETAIKTAAT